MRQPQKQSCQKIEIEVSAMIDGELPMSEALGVVDHLLECDQCRSFYCLARGLDTALDQAQVSARAGELPVGLWSRIDSTLSSEAADTAQDKVVALSQTRRRVQPWLLKVAAMVLVLVGGWLVVLQSPVPGPSGRDDVLRVLLESDRGAMTDERFIELTTELLRSDRRYHLKMLEIMAALAERTQTSEGNPEPRLSVPVWDDSGLRRSSNEPESPERYPGRT